MGRAKSGGDPDAQKGEEEDGEQQAPACAQAIGTEED